MDTVITNDNCSCDNKHKVLTWVDDSDAEYHYYYKCTSCGNRFYTYRRLVSEVTPIGI